MEESERPDSRYAAGPGPAAAGKSKKPQRSIERLPGPPPVFRIVTKKKKKRRNAPDEGTLSNPPEPKAQAESEEDVTVASVATLRPPSPASTPITKTGSSSSASTGTTTKSVRFDDVSDASYRESYLELQEHSVDESTAGRLSSADDLDEGPPVDLGDFGDVFAYLSLAQERFRTRLTHRGNRLLVPVSVPTPTDGEGTMSEANEGVVSRDFAKKSSETPATKKKKKKPKSKTFEQERRDEPRAYIIKRPLSEAAKAASRVALEEHRKRNRIDVHEHQQEQSHSQALQFQPASVHYNVHFTQDVHTDDDDLRSAYGLPLDGPTKSTSLMSKLEARFPDETAFKTHNIFRPSSPLPAALAASDQPPSVFIFVDHSNVHLGFLKHVQAHFPGLDLRGFKRARPMEGRPGALGKRKVRLDYDSLFAVLERGRNVVVRYLAASSPLYQRLDVPISRGYEVQIMERVLRPDPVPAGPTSATHFLQPLNRKTDFASASTESEGEGPGRDVVRPLNGPAFRLREQGLDEIIQLAIVDAVDEFGWIQGQEERPRPVLVLASGDANPGEFSKRGFRGRVSNALRDGWDVEVFGWSGSISHWYFDEARRTKALPADGKEGRLVVVELDGFVEELLADEA